MNRSIIYILSVIHLSFVCGEPITLGVSALIGGGLIGGLAFGYCKFYECCNDKYITEDYNGLRSDIKSMVYGQPLVNELVPILRAHTRQKALVVSLHGWPGNGKNYVVNMTANRMFKYGLASKYVKMYLGRYDFPDPGMVYEYMVNVKTDIVRIVKSCPKALIIFDEVSDTPPQLLDVLKPMIDYHGWVDGVDFGQSTFVFISNVGGNKITEHLIRLATPREELKLTDFDQVIREISYEHPGGFHKAAMLDSHLIDHYIPFLPMEQSHVRMCVMDEFIKQKYFSPTEEMIEAAMAVITYGPPSNPIYANAGCKRIKKQVSYVIQQWKHKYR